MSYILDALKKLEQKRGQEEAPKVLIFGRHVAPERRKRRTWTYALLSALLLNAAIMVWWTTPWRAAYRDTGSELPAIREPGGPQALQTDGQKQHAPEEKIVALPDKPSTPAPKTPLSEPAPEVAARPSSSPAKPAVPKPAPTREAKAPEPEGKATQAATQKQRRTAAAEPSVMLNELPPFIRNELPVFTVSGHAYSPEPQRRVVRVNDKILLEGQELKPGLRVEEIIPDGIVFTYEGYRFRVAVTLNR